MLVKRTMRGREGDDVERAEAPAGRDVVLEERRRRVALLRAVRTNGGLAGLLAYCERVLSDAASSGR